MAAVGKRIRNKESNNNNNKNQQNPTTTKKNKQKNPTTNSNRQRNGTWRRGSVFLLYLIRSSVAGASGRSVGRRNRLASASASAAAATVNMEGTGGKKSTINVSCDETRAMAAARGPGWFFLTTGRPHSLSLSLTKHPPQKKTKTKNTVDGGPAQPNTGSKQQQQQRKKKKKRCSY